MQEVLDHNLIGWRNQWIGHHILLNKRYILPRSYSDKRTSLLIEKTKRLSLTKIKDIQKPEPSPEEIAEQAFLARNLFASMEFIIICQILIFTVKFSQIKPSIIEGVDTFTRVKRIAPYF